MRIAAGLFEARKRRQTSKPSSLGSMTSSTTNAGCSRATASSAASPSLLEWVRKPSRSKYMRASSIMEGSSSTRMMSSFTTELGDSHLLRESDCHLLLLITAYHVG